MAGSLSALISGESPANITVFMDEETFALMF